VSDRDSGGVVKANRKARGADVWALAWDKGFANWTYVDEEGVDNVTMRIEFSEGQEASEGNVILQLGASVDGMSAKSCICRANDQNLNKRYRLQCSTSVIQPQRSP
jgi:peroxiredoxin